MRALRACLLLLTLLAATVMGWSCSAGGGGFGDTEGSSDGDGSGGAGGGLSFTGGGPQNSLTLEPAQATIVVDNDMSMPVQFTASYAGQQVFPGKWWVDFSTMATVDSSGVVSATNKAGGVVQVFAEHDNVKASATVIIQYNKEVDLVGLDPSTKDLLKNATAPDAAIQWTYPYDGTVFPQGLLGPEMMWNGGGATDVYYVHFQGATFDYGIFTSAPPPSRFQMDQAAWVAVSESGDGGDVDVKVARLPLGAPSAGIAMSHTWRVASSRMNGTIYYWANSLGRVVRIQPGAAAPDDFLANAGQGGCSTCHTVSANGHTLIIGGDIAASNFDLLNNVVTISNQGRRWAMPAVSPDGKYVVENNQQIIPGPPGGDDGLWDAVTGQKVPGSGLDGISLHMPAFGPAGKHLAYVDPSSLGLGVFAYDVSASPMVSSPLPLVPAGSDQSLNCIAFPSVSPTIKSGEFQTEQTWIVYHRGVYSASLDTRSGPGDLYLASADMPNVEIELAEANGKVYPFAAGDRDRHYNYEPTFAPQASGGYMWVVFTSRRTYGNRLTGGKDSVKQLWMVGIDQFPEAGKDPSHPAFWLPGQDQTTLNMRGYWALDPCIQQGDMCVEDEDCCNGEMCIEGLCGGPEECAESGEYCESDEDCCDPSEECINNECKTEGPA